MTITTNNNFFCEEDFIKIQQKIAKKINGHSYVTITTIAVLIRISLQFFKKLLCSRDRAAVELQSPSCCMKVAVP